MSIVIHQNQNLYCKGTENITNSGKNGVDLSMGMIVLD